MIFHGFLFEIDNVHGSRIDFFLHFLKTKLLRGFLIIRMIKEDY